MERVILCLEPGTGLGLRRPSQVLGLADKLGLLMGLLSGDSVWPPASLHAKGTSLHGPLVSECGTGVPVDCLLRITVAFLLHRS